MSEHLNQYTVFAEGFFRKFANILQPYLSDVCISKSTIDNPGTLLSLRQFVDILELAAKGRQEDCLGLHLGEKLRAEDLGVLGHAILHAQNVEQLIRTYIRYFVVYAQGVKIDLNKSARYATISYQLTDACILNYRQDAEMALSFIHSLIRDNVGEDWKIQEVQFIHDKPVDTSEHHRIFNAPLVFKKSNNAIIINKNLLTKRLKAADKRLFPVLESYLEAALPARSEEVNLVVSARDILAKSLSTDVLSLADLANEMGISKWTLQRRLRNSGITYNQLINDTRTYLAQSYLVNTEIPLTEIAFLVGFSEMSSFGRAFRRLTGKTPSEYRREHQKLSRSKTD